MFARQLIARPTSYWFCDWNSFLSKFVVSSTTSVESLKHWHAARYPMRLWANRGCDMHSTTANDAHETSYPVICRYVSLRIACAFTNGSVERSSARAQARARPAHALEVEWHTETAVVAWHVRTCSSERELARDASRLTCFAFCDGLADERRRVPLIRPDALHQILKRLLEHDSEGAQLGAARPRARGRKGTRARHSHSVTVERRLRVSRSSVQAHCRRVQRSSSVGFARALPLND